MMTAGSRGGEGIKMDRKEQPEREDREWRKKDTLANSLKEEAILFYRLILHPELAKSMHVSMYMTHPRHVHFLY